MSNITAKIKNNVIKAYLKTFPVTTYGAGVSTWGAIIGNINSQLDLMALFLGYVKVTDIVDDLTSLSDTKPLSANQGRVLKGFIDNINTLLLSDETNLDTLQEIVNFIELNRDSLDNLSISSIAGLQIALDSKANSSHAHVKGDITDFSDADYATAAQGAKADSALQSGDNISELINDAGYITSQDKSEYIVIGASDENTALEVGTAKTTFRIPWTGTITGVRASLTTACTGANLQVDINKGGTSILSTILSIDDGEKTSTTATTPAVISTSAVTDDDEYTIDIDQVGSTVVGTGLKVTILGTRT